MAMKHKCSRCKRITDTKLYVFEEYGIMANTELSDLCDDCSLAVKNYIAGNEDTPERVER